MFCSTMYNYNYVAGFCLLCRIYLFLFYVVFVIIKLNRTVEIVKLTDYSNLCSIGLSLCMRSNIGRRWLRILSCFFKRFLFKPIVDRSYAVPEYGIASCLLLSFSSGIPLLPVDCECVDELMGDGYFRYQM